MKKLLEFIIAQIVDHPQSVKIKKEADKASGFNNYQISVHPQDIGQVIGRQGKIIKAIRRLAYVLATTKGEKINLQLLETQGKEKISLSEEKGTNSTGPSPTFLK